MKRKIFFIILALLCVAGAVVLVVVGIRATSHPAVIPGLESLGEVTLEAYEARRGESTEDEPYTIYYRYIDPKYGEIVFANAVSDEDYYSFLYDRMRADDAQEGEVPEETDEITKPTTIKRYVYVYPADGHYEAVFEDRYMGLTDVSDLIDPSPKVSATYYYIVAGILLLAGAYLLFLAFTGERTPERASRSAQNRR
ncbi:MAG: hypothetical protein IKP38_05645 [Clostridia bacterium]|nr:hypothetical protein [Clostridia bacterium]